MEQQRLPLAQFERLDGPPRADHPFAGAARGVIFPSPPTLGVPFEFLSQEGGGHTSQVISGSYTRDGAKSVWEFKTVSGSTYRLSLDLSEVQGDMIGKALERLAAGGPDILA